MNRTLQHIMMFFALILLAAIEHAIAWPILTVFFITIRLQRFSAAVYAAIGVGFAWLFQAWYQLSLPGIFFSMAVTQVVGMIAFRLSASHRLSALVAASAWSVYGFMQVEYRMAVVLWWLVSVVVMLVWMRFFEKRTSQLQLSRRVQSMLQQK